MARKILSIALGTLIVTGGGMAAGTSLATGPSSHAATLAYSAGAGPSTEDEDDSGWQ